MNPRLLWRSYELSPTALIGLVHSRLFVELVHLLAGQLVSPLVGGGLVAASALLGYFKVSYVWLFDKQSLVRARLSQ